MKASLLSILIFSSATIFAQFHLREEFFSPKPQISVNGDVCAIQNGSLSCMPRTCNSVTIYTGDSISFCTFDHIDLTTDTAYYMQWNFSGSSNYPVSQFDYVPSTLPVCYYPVWNIPGSYVVDIFYNGWLSTYPGRDCYLYGPSHWIINVTVLPSQNVFENVSQNFNGIIFPNPAKNKITIETAENKKYVALIINPLGNPIIRQFFREKIEINVSVLSRGLYLMAICDENGVKCYVEKVIVE